MIWTNWSKAADFLMGLHVAATIGLYFVFSFYGLRGKKLHIAELWKTKVFRFAFWLWAVITVVWAGFLIVIGYRLFNGIL